MKFFKMMIFAVLFVFITSSAGAFALTNELPQSEHDIMISQLNFEKVNPVKELEALKSKAKDDYKQGKLSKDELNLILSKIELKLKAVKEFNTLSLDEKKDRLISNFTKAVNKKVQEGEISANDVDKILDQFTESVKQWDGQGFPTFYHRGLLISKKGTSHDKHDHQMHKNCMHHMHMKFVEALDKAVKEGIINEKEKKQILQFLHDSMKEMK